MSAAPILIVRFDAGNAGRRIAGVSAAGRFAGAAKAAGLAEVWIVAPDGEPAPDDLARIWPEGARLVPQSALAAELAAHAGTPVIALSGRYLPSADTLRALSAPAVAPALPEPETPASDAIDLADSARARRRIIRATAKASDGWVSRTLNRPISQAITSLLIGIPWMRPTHVTLLVGLIAPVMFGLLVFGGTGGLIAGGVLFHVASVLDGVDGELARAAFRGSAFGAKLDTRVDMLTNVGFGVGLISSLTQLYGWHHAALAGAAFVIVLGGWALLGWLYARNGERESFNGLKTVYRGRFPRGVPRAIVELIVAFTSRDGFAFFSASMIVLGVGYVLSWTWLGLAVTWIGAILAAAPGMLRGSADA